MRARLAAWRAQAHHHCGETEAARAALARARSLAEVAEPEALPGLEVLAEVIEGAAPSSPPPAPPGPSLPDTPIARALQALARGAIDQARIHGHAALDQAHTPRDRVLALLALARLPDDAPGYVARAAEVADTAGDPNLVAAVVRASRECGVPLPPRVF